MRSPKVEGLWRLIDWFNNRFPSTEIQKAPLVAGSLDQTAWLSGFIEADGHFTVRLSESKNYPRRIECKFELTQARKGSENETFIQEISKMLQSRLELIRSEHPHPQYRIRTQSVLTNKLLIDYLIKFPLFGSKYLDFYDWNTVVQLFEAKTHNTPAGLLHVDSIRSGINDKRTVFNWDHIQKFYNLDK
jgi:hypothetical protein